MSVLLNDNVIKSFSLSTKSTKSTYSVIDKEYKNEQLSYQIAGIMFWDQFKKLLSILKIHCRMLMSLFPQVLSSQEFMTDFQCDGVQM